MTNDARANRELYSGCELIQLQNNTKAFKKGNPPATVDYRGGIAAVNGSGGLVVVDIDGKNDGTLEALHKALPGTRGLDTRVVSTASKNSWHVVYRLPDGFTIRTGIHIAADGVEVPPFYVLPGSRYKGVEYTVVEDHPVADAPEDLLAVLDAGLVVLDDDDDGEQVTEEPTGPEGVDELLQRLAKSPAGTRNATYLAVALQVLDILGPEAGAEALRKAWPGDEEELEHKLSSSLRGTGFVPGPRKVSGRRAELINRLARLVVFGPWKGRAGTMHRRVLWTVMARCLQQHQLTVRYATNSLAVDSGTYPSRVTDALDALSDAGWIVTSRGIITVCVRPTGEDLPDLPVGLAEPNNPVWFTDRLNGRHSQVLAWYLAGERTGGRIASRSGISRQAVSEQLKALAELGVLGADVDMLDALAADGIERRDCIRKYVEERLERKQAFEESLQPEETSDHLGRKVPPKSVVRRPPPESNQSQPKPPERRLVFMEEEPDF